ncbi:MAG: hypothetical protein KGN34_00790 [Sphingomonadales bacterium]|nr:hypothetical protein [Sphingomonadales bacterium]
MANDEIDNDATPPAGHAGSASDPGSARAKPASWANGLRALYDSVVEEPLPDSFMDLLSKLDQDPE